MSSEVASTSTPATFDQVPVEYTRRRSSAGSNNTAAAAYQPISNKAVGAGAHAVRCHLCSGLFVISNTCSNCHHKQCKECL